MRLQAGLEGRAGLFNLLYSVVDLIFFLFAISMSAALSSASASATAKTSAGQRTIRPPGAFSAMAAITPFSGSLLMAFITAIFAYMTYTSFKRNQRELGHWGCRMSWMNPNYIKMDGPTGGDVGNLGTKYGLYLYREGGMAQAKVSWRSETPFCRC